jgi:Na+/melibiose symporter-like transporter
MGTLDDIYASDLGDAFELGRIHPVQIDLEPQLNERDRLTTAFRLVLALPHLVLVGGPVALMFSHLSRPEAESFGWQAGGGVLGAVAFVSALIAWFAIVFGARHPDGLRRLASFYLHWRVRAVAYTALLRDEYPPFGDGPYPVALRLTPPASRNRLTVAFRPFLALPQLIVIWGLGLAWAVTTLIAWFAILFTGRYPRGLYNFGVGALRWTTRVEAYVLLLDDAYPPFSLH